jgi:NADH-quinone oxidoreductase subunit J
VAAPVFFFYGFALIAVVGAIGMVLNVRNAVASAMSLVVTMVALAGIYVLLGAHLVAAFQIMVYGGAIVVLFLFVVMLLNVGSEQIDPGRQFWVRLFGAGAVLVAMAMLLRILTGLPELPPEPAGFGGHRHVGIALYTDYVLLVELASLVLLAAIVGALILAKQRID